MYKKVILFLFYISILVANETQYSYTKKALYQPQLMPIFINHSKMMNIDTKSKNLSLRNAWWFASFSHLAYFNKREIKKELKRVNLNFEAFYDIEGTQAFIASSKESVVVSFRGTQVDENRDLKTDINAFFTTIRAEAEVHRGFYKAYSRVKNQIIKKLQPFKKKGYKIYYTGHSLGAALATLMAIDTEPTAIYTYGSPMVGDKKFTQLLKNVKIYRFVNSCDIVPTLPSIISKYSHIGEFIFFDYRGKMIINPSLTTLTKINTEALLEYAKKMTLFKKGYVSFRTLADHSIYNYTVAILRAERVGLKP